MSALDQLTVGQLTPDHTAAFCQHTTFKSAMTPHSKPCTSRKLLPWVTPSILLIYAAFSHAQNTLPVFALKPSRTSEGKALRLAQAINPFISTVGYTKTYNEKTFIIRANDNSTIVELDIESGGVWMADETRLFNTDLRNIRLPDERSALEIGDSLARKYALLPAVQEPFKFTRGTVGGTFFAEEKNTEVPGEYRRKDFQLDVSLNYDITVSVPGLKQELPVLGGGGKFQVVLGENGRMIGFNGVWRGVANEGKQYKVIPRQTAEQEYLGSLDNSLKVISYKLSLAYFSAPTGTSQEFLYPVYVHATTVLYGDEEIELRRSLRPATDFGPINTFTPEPESPRPFEVKTTQKARRRAKTRSIQRRGKDDQNQKEAGVEYLGTSWGLSNSKENAAGFRSELLDEGWAINFDYANYHIWETDWNFMDDDCVDDVDFVFYTGLANANGWSVARPLFGMVRYNIVSDFFPGTPGDKWGERDLEWLIIAASGPLQDDRIKTGGGNAIERWRGMFDGMHMMMAYGSNSVDSPEEGKRFVRHAKEGSTLINAWFRTAKELQSSGVWAAAMWASTPGNDTRFDHLPGRGFVSGDPARGPGQVRNLAWVQC